MIIKDNIEKDALLQIAKNACLCARTAPKARGRDNIEFLILSGNEKNEFAGSMKKLSEEFSHKGFLRDCENVRQAEILILIGSRTERMNLNPCGLCGYRDCKDNEDHQALCAFTPGDLGIAIGSLVSFLADHRVDNRIMYTAGVTAVRTGILGKDINIAYGIPLSATGKNPFFDRKPS